MASPADITDSDLRCDIGAAIQILENRTLGGRLGNFQQLLLDFSVLAVFILWEENRTSNRVKCAFWRVGWGCFVARFLKCHCAQLCTEPFLVSEVETVLLLSDVFGTEFDFRKSNEYSTVLVFSLFQYPRGLDHVRIHVAWWRSLRRVILRAYVVPADIRGPGTSTQLIKTTAKA